MNILLLSGSTIGSKTRIAMEHCYKQLKQHSPESEITFIDLADYQLQFSDGRHYLDYDGDTAHVTQSIMNADIIMIGSPIFQASIPGTLKNVFDLLPTDGLRDKVISMIITAGSSKHYLVPMIQLKPILTYMKGSVVDDYVFIEEKDYHLKEIVNDDVFLRIDRLIDDTITQYDALQYTKEKEVEKYGF
ncbi:FMN reductase [Pelagirhabdus alkalitolerans]|uniref:FMN reductase n=1 Tax=Pelagirhabdus alkalitolerans TaxID=1612202 RepID=A0A1G6II43_9BACI|nr:NADPH-dependent FMN reductase [Pelagirhabdus alkalitolerans]SDC06090.1 FMN reductase [Pelagirhabdus alkalitolerans]